MTFEIKCDELRELVENGGQLIDVRSNLEYSQGALANAVNIPLETIPHQKQKFWVKDHFQAG